MKEFCLLLKAYFYIIILKNKIASFSMLEIYDESHFFKMLNKEYMLQKYINSRAQ